MGSGGVAEQLCLEVAPSILIDFICAHVSASERAGTVPRDRERSRAAAFEGSASRAEPSGAGRRRERERMKEGR